MITQMRGKTTQISECALDAPCTEPCNFDAPLERFACFTKTWSIIYGVMASNQGSRRFSHGVFVRFLEQFARRISDS